MGVTLCGISRGRNMEKLEVTIYKESNPGHGVHKVIEPTYGNKKIEFYGFL